MDSFEMNKIMGAVLGTCLVVLSLNIAADAVFHPVKPPNPATRSTVPEKPKPGEKTAPEKDVPIEQLLAKADVGRGKSTANQCVACHTFDKGGKALRRPQSLRHHRPCEGIGCGLQLFRRIEKGRRQLDG